MSLGVIALLALDPIDDIAGTVINCGLLLAGVVWDHMQSDHSSDTSAHSRRGNRWIAPGLIAAALLPWVPLVSVVTTVINGNRIFDGLNSEAVSEVKNLAKLSFVRQLRDYADDAFENGLRLDIYVREDTRISGPLAAADLDPNNPVNIIPFLP